MVATHNDKADRGGVVDGHVVYLTGATGFIGQRILTEIDSDSKIRKVYCPVRDKKGESGAERFVTTGLSKFKKTVYISTNGNIVPDDVTVVILNAYEVKFFNPVDQIVKNNVTPMLQILDQCEAAGSRIRGISLVSTAYVQEPFPYRRREGNRIGWVLRKFTSASQVYEDLVTDKISWDALKDKYADSISTYYQNNCYAFSKHIMEHTIHERYPNLPVCVVRPSIVCVTRDAKYGCDTKTGFPLFMTIARTPVLRFPRNEGELNLVFVEEVARDVVDGGILYAAPADKDESNELFHPVRSSTSSADLTSISVFELARGGVIRFDLHSYDKLRKFLRTLEIAFIQLIKGKRKSQLVDLVYKNFDPFMGNNWDFEKVHPVSKKDLEMLASCWLKQEKQKELEKAKTKAKTKEASQTFLMLSTLLSLLLVFVAFAYTLHTSGLRPQYFPAMSEA